MFLTWSRQGRVWWNEDWIKRQGATRERIPGFDDHVSFANYDLRLNNYEPIELTADGRPFLRCFGPVAVEEIASLLENVVRLYGPSEYDVAKRTLFGQLVETAGMLDVVHFHGFDPAVRTDALDFLDSLSGGRRELRRIEYNDRD